MTVEDQGRVGTAPMPSPRVRRSGLECLGQPALPPLNPTYNNTRGASTAPVHGTDHDDFPSPMSRDQSGYGRGHRPAAAAYMLLRTQRPVTGASGTGRRFVGLARKRAHRPRTGGGWATR
jgi:hypothetical protein